MVEGDSLCRAVSADVSGPFVLEVCHEGVVIKEVSDLRESGKMSIRPDLQAVVDEDGGNGLVVVVNAAEEGDEVGGCSYVVWSDREDLQRAFVCEVT